jgi:hypothetical protein
MTKLKTEFSRLPGGDGYLMEIRTMATELRIERLHRERGGELVGELALLSSLPGARSVEGIVHVANFNLSSDRTRNERAKIYAERLNANGLDVPLLLEEFCQRVLAAERIGAPAQMLRDLPPIDKAEDLDVDKGFRLLRRHPVIVFGDGGDAKSYLSLYFAARMAARGLRVLYADWEFAGEDHRDRLHRITGDAMPELWYVRCERALIHEADRLVRIVQENRIDYWVADSIVFACDGPPESAETAGAYFRAVRRIGIGSLHVAHTTKGENGDQKPFGSAFWHNGARSTWYVKRSEGVTAEDEINVGLYNRKTNVGPRAKPIGYHIAFGPDRTVFTRSELMDVQDLAAKTSVASRITHLLKEGVVMTMAEIAATLEVPIDTIVKTVNRGEGKRFVKVAGEDQIFRIGLLAA